MKQTSNREKFPFLLLWEVLFWVKNPEMRQFCRPLAEKEFMRY